MEFRLAAEDQDLQKIVREFLSAQSPESEVRITGTEIEHDAELWSGMARLGLQGIAIPSVYGGAGYGFVQLGVVLEELGRSLAISPFLGTCVMASELLLGLDDEDACRRWLPGIASGELIVAVGLAEDSGSWDPNEIAATARLGDDSWLVSGRKSYVLDGVSADMFLVVARLEGDAGDDLGVFAVEANSAGVSCEPLTSWDQTRKVARIRLEGVPATRVGNVLTTRAALERMLDHTAIAVAAECVGGIARTLEMSVEYVKEREQFGRPIGSFQAIKHKCASMLVDLESARSAVLYATWAASVLHEDVVRVAPLAKAFCADAYVHAATENIQMHGGIGFTWEHPAHLYLKRAKNMQAFLGSSDFHRQRLAERLGIGAQPSVHRP